MEHAGAPPGPRPASPQDRPYPDRLRVGVVLRGLRLPAWQLVTLGRIMNAGFADLALIVIAEGEGTRSVSDDDATPHSTDKADGVVGHTLRRAIRRLEAKFDCEHDAFAEDDATTLVRGIPVVPARAGEGETLVAAVAQYGVDVFLAFGSRRVADQLAPVATHGVWSLTHTHGAPDDPAAAGFWPVYHGWSVAEVHLEQLAPDGSRRTLATSFPATNLYSIRLNRSNLFWRSASLLLPKLRELRVGTPHPILAAEPDRARGDDGLARVALGAPTAAQLAIHVSRNVGRRARASLARHFMLDQWILLFHLGEEVSSSPEAFTRIVPPKDRFWADPHVIRRDGRYYVFLEECPFATGKGHIAVLTIAEDGTWSAPTTVLEQAYHLSYPFVFEDEGELYMVPESEANRTVDLYRCVEFPLKWELVTTLMRDVTATDSTLVRHEGRWWLFANVIETKGESFSEELCLFCAQSLTGGDWKPHARNPIVSDSRRSRPAGAIFRRNGRLYRPAQDCSVRYGYGIRVHEIERLSESDYAESEVFSVMPTWDSRIIATHTLSYTPGLTVLDALQPRLRFM